MDRHRRMARVLGCLVASMTLGAALLDYFQPSRSEAGSKTELVAVQLLNSIQPTAQAQSPIQNWHTIHLCPSDATSPSNADDVHFLVSAEGKWKATDSWRAQRPLNSAGVLRIGLQSAGRNGVTEAQWAGAQELVHGLQQTCRISDISRDSRLRAASATPQKSRPRPSETKR